MSTPILRLYFYRYLHRNPIYYVHLFQHPAIAGCCDRTRFLNLLDADHDF